MLIVGILLLIIGAAVATLTNDRTVRLFGLIAAGLGLLLILLLVLGAGGLGDGLDLDGGDGDGDRDARAPHVVALVT